MAKQFRITGIDNRTNKPLQAMVEAPDEAQAYIIARKLFASVDRIEKIANAPAAHQNGARANTRIDDGELGPELEDEDEDEDEEIEIPDLSTLTPDTPRSHGSFKALIRQYQGQIIGINLEDPGRFSVVKLISVSHEYFTIRIQNDPLTYHFPIRGIVAVMESAPDNPTPSVKSSKPGLFVEVAPTRILPGVKPHFPAGRA